MLSRLATLIDTYGWRKRYKAYATGWSSNSRPDIGFYQTKKAQYRYRCTGEGQTIVFLADAPVTIEAYDEIIEILSPHYRVVVAEAAGMGFSAANIRYGFAFNESSDDMALFLKDVAGPGSILAFSCAAGLSAVNIASRYPDLVSRLFLIQTTDWGGFQNWVNKCDPKRVLRRPILGQLTLKTLGPKEGLNWLRYATGKAEKVLPLCCCTQQGFEQGMLFSLASILQRYLKKEKPLGRPTQPITILWGEADRSHSAENIERSRSLGDRVDIIKRPSLGHFPELEDPKGLYEILQTLEPTPASLS